MQPKRTTIGAEAGGFEQHGGPSAVPSAATAAALTIACDARVLRQYACEVKRQMYNLLLLYLLSRLELISPYMHQLSEPSSSCPCRMHARNARLRLDSTKKRSSSAKVNYLRPDSSRSLRILPSASFASSLGIRNEPAS